MNDKLYIKIVKHVHGRNIRWVIDSRCVGQWDFSGPYNKPSYGTRREAREVVQRALDSGLYPQGTEIVQ